MRIKHSRQSTGTRRAGVIVNLNVTGCLEGTNMAIEPATNASEQPKTHEIVAAELRTIGNRFIGGSWSLFAKVFPTILTIVLVILVIVSPLAIVVVGKHFDIDPQLGVRLAELLYGWPIIVGVCIISFAFLFRTPLGKLMGGIHGLRAGNIELQMGQQAPIATTGDPRTGEITWEQWSLEVFSSLSPRDRELILRLGIQQRQLFADMQNAWWFEKVWGEIFGTQVELLATLQRHDSHELLYESVVAIFDKYEKKRLATLPEGSTPFTQEQKIAMFRAWLSYLESMYLIQRMEKGIQLTELGEKFLNYLPTQGYSVQTRVW